MLPGRGELPHDSGCFRGGRHLRPHSPFGDVAQDEDGRERQDRHHEQRHAGAERDIIALDAQAERPGGEHVREVDRTAGGQHLHDVELAKVTISENSAVIAMMLRIIGRVMYQMRCHQLAPSMAAAS